jgi:hypothetical protein
VSEDIDHGRERSRVREGRSLQDKLRSAWRRERLFAHARGILHVVAWSCLLLAGTFLLDRALFLPGAGRIAVLLGGLGCLASVGWLRWGRHLHRFEALRTALRVERLHPELDSILVSHVQLAAEPHDRTGAAPRLIEAMHAEAHRVAAPLDFGEIVRFRALRGLSLSAASALAALLLSAVLWWELFAVFLARMGHPSVDLAYPTRTRIAGVTGDLRVAEGASVSLVAVATGEVPAAGEILVRQGDAPWERIAVERAGDAPGGAQQGGAQQAGAQQAGAQQAGAARGGGEFRRKLEAVHRSFVYRFRIGDASTPPHRVDVVPPARLLRYRTILRAPAYTALPEREVDSLNIEVLEGTLVEWVLEYDRALSSHDLVEDGGAAFPFRIDPADGRVAGLRREATESFSYHLRWADREGFSGEGSVAYTVDVSEDVAPEVEILTPAEDEIGTLEKTVAISFQARDDHGLAEAWLVHSRGGGPEVRERIGLVGTGPSSEAVGVRWKPRASIPDLAEGETLAFLVEVSDNRTGPAGPNLGRSRLRKLSIASVAEYLERIGERKAQLLGNIQGVLREETDSAERIDSLKEVSR